MLIGESGPGCVTLAIAAVAPGRNSRHVSLALWSESVAGGNSSGAEALAGATVTTTDCVLSGHMSEVLANPLSRAQRVVDR